MRLTSTIFACCLAFLITSGASAQTSTGEIPEEAQKRLDHIIGRWEFKTEYLTPNGEVRRTVEGTEEAKYIIDGRVVELTTVVAGATSKAWMFYNIAEEQFYLTSVDERGDLWILAGGLDAFVITSQPRQLTNGRELTIRFTHDNIQPDSFEAVMESSIDGGESWMTRSKQFLTKDTD